MRTFFLIGLFPLFSSLALAAYPSFAETSLHIKIALDETRVAKEIDLVIQRYAIIGTSKDGQKLAVMLTHFGPSSGAPFANLLVLEAGFSAPIFKANAFSMQGDEGTLASLAVELFERNKQELQNLGIDFEFPKYADANYIVELSNISKSVEGQGSCARQLHP